MQASPEKLNDEARELLANPANVLLLSAASSWEIAIKYALGKLPLPASPASYVPDRLRSGGVTPLAVSHAHALAVAELPDHHRDPFDRLLVTQAHLDGLTLLTADSKLGAYDVRIIWAR
ncbi:MAG: type II toxin-antitoxin system VapC family toxin [Pseudonocardiaceae bacterium]